MNTETSPPGAMDSVSRALDEAEHALGGRPAFAKLFEVTPSAIGNWKSRGVPVKAAVRIESLVPAVTRRRLRPDDYQEIWPELAHGASPDQPPHQSPPGAAAAAGHHDTGDRRRVTDFDASRHAPAGG